MGRNIEDLDRDRDATDDVAAERKKDPAAIERADDKAKERKKITLDDVEPTTTAGGDDSMGMSQNMREERDNEKRPTDQRH